MKYLLLGDDYKRLFVENESMTNSIWYSKDKKEWIKGENELWDARMGFDPSEPEDSPYRIGNSSCMKDIVEITKEEAEEFISEPIDEKEIKRLLKIQ